MVPKKESLQKQTKQNKSKLVVKHIVQTDNIIDLSNTIYSDLTKYIPKNPHKQISFELHNSTPAFANAIRRCLTNELELKYLTVSMNDIHTNDDFIINDVIQQRLEMISIDQDIPDDAVMTIVFENNSNISMDAYTDYLRISTPRDNRSSKSSLVKSDTMFVNNLINICCINPHKFISIKNIKVKKTTGIENGRTSLGTIGYKIINHDMTQSSLNSSPNTFKITIETNGNIRDPKIVIQWVVVNLKQRLNHILNSLLQNRSNSRYTFGDILDEIEEYKSDDILEDSNKDLESRNNQDVYYILEFGIFKLFVNNENITIGKLLETYIFLLGYKSTMKYPHPSKNEFIININSTDGKNICIQAIGNILDDFDTLNTSL